MIFCFFFFQAEDGIRDKLVTGVQTCALPILTGHNTDVVGFEESLRPLLQPHHTKALVLGTGGAAKAVNYVLNKLGIEFRSEERRVGKECRSRWSREH